VTHQTLQSIRCAAAPSTISPSITSPKSPCRSCKSSDRAIRNWGYARRLLSNVVERILPDLVFQKTSALVAKRREDLNPEALPPRSNRLSRKTSGSRWSRSATVSGDDILPIASNELLDRGIEFRNMDTGEPLSVIRDHVAQCERSTSAQFPIAQAPCGGARAL